MHNAPFGEPRVTARFVNVPVWEWLRAPIIKFKSPALISKKLTWPDPERLEPALRGDLYGRFSRALYGGLRQI